jgi:hypothetical protein
LSCKCGVVAAVWLGFWSCCVLLPSTPPPPIALHRHHMLCTSTPFVCPSSSYLVHVMLRRVGRGACWCVSAGVGCPVPMFGLTGWAACAVCTVHARCTLLYLCTAGLFVCMTRLCGGPDGWNCATAAPRVGRKQSQGTPHTANFGCYPPPCLHCLVECSVLLSVVAHNVGRALY